MNKSFRRFTLVEMLTVIAIISILAGLVIPIVIISRQRGRETQAKSDIAAIVSAIKKLDADYSKMLYKDGTNYKIGGKDVDVSSDIATIDGEVYDAMIAELSAPKAKDVSVSVNKRKRSYLEPKKGFDPTKTYSDQKDTLWRDPWGKPYKVYVKVTRDGELELPGCKDDKTIAADVAVYSFGANGTDDKGCNVELDECISSGTHKNHDDIASWNL